MVFQILPAANFPQYRRKSDLLLANGRGGSYFLRFFFFLYLMISSVTFWSCNKDGLN